jgi:hypothetical protein
VGVFSGPDVNESGLVLNYDFGNFEKAFGTNNLSSNIGLSIYNNVSGDVSASLTQTSDTYKGSVVWRLTLTPITASGVSYLTAGNNPGLGVVTGGGGGTGGVYTGHSIFFRPTVNMHSSPIYTHYSNIAGWQSSTNYDDMKDGWYRAHVVWYDTVTRSDGKYWAINPASATLNVPIVTFWAAPFKESQNYVNFVSAYTSGTRGPGSGVVNLVDQSFSGGQLTNGPTYNSSNGGSIVFDGSNDMVIIPENPALNTQTPSVEVWVKTNATTQNGFWFEKGQVNTQYSLFQEGGVIQWRQNFSGSVTNLSTTTATYMNTSNWYQVVGTFTSGARRLYINGVLVNSDTQSGTITTNANGMSIGVYGGFNGSRGYYYNGNIASVKIYNRELTASEIQQNFNATKSRYGL